MGMSSESVSLCEIENFASSQLPHQEAIERSMDKNHKAALIQDKWKSIIDFSSLNQTTRYSAATVQARGGNHRVVTTSSSDSTSSDSSFSSNTYKSNNVYRPKNYPNEQRMAH